VKSRPKKRAAPRSGAAKSEKLWGGRFTQGADPTAERFTGSLAFDRRLWPHDVAGSVAWAKALAKAGLLSAAERDAIVRGLAAVRDELAAGTFPYRAELEDIHTNVERRLQELIGDVGGKLHTGRSRNDQIAVDERLYLREVIARIRAGLRRVQEALVARAAETIEAPLPGYTHLQRAQPIVLGHHLLAYVFMLQRDRERFGDCGARASTLPLGAAALAGTAFPIDLEALAKDLGFAAVSPNSLDSVSDRDTVLEFLSAGAITGMHLSRLAADLTLWATAEFGFVEFSDAFATGSSIMPQKKNPDVAELVRGKSGRLYGNLVAVLTTMKGLPLAYNSDMQEDKEPLFDSVDTLEAILSVVPPMLASLAFRTDRMRRAAGENFATATDLADYLVRKGMAFRQAHVVVGRIVRFCETEGKPLEGLSVVELRRFSSLFDDDAKDAVTVEASLRARAVTGGTAPDAVRRSLALARTFVARA
jgi:argininosuccinate lyase